MSCIKAPQLPLPPGLDLLLPSLTFGIVVPGSGLCCTFEPPPIPGSPFILPIGSIPGVATILQPVITTIMTAIDLINMLLDELSFSCPLD